MLLLAHRGYHAVETENTMAAFAAAAAQGVDGIETDVRLSRDGEALLIHDRVVGQGSARRPVAHLTRREAEQLAGHPIPTLAEALEGFPELVWNIEIKTPDALPEAVRVLKQYQGGVRLLVTSFRHDVVKRCAELLEVDCGALLAHRPLDVAPLIAEFREHKRVSTFVWDFNILDETLVWEASAAGWGSYVYGAITPEEHAHCVQLELEGVITDYPEQLRR